MKVRFKKLHPDAVTPAYAKHGDAGLDLTAISIKRTKNYIEYGTGIAIEIPENHVGLQFPRSSVTTTGLILKNSVGVIDSGYRGELKVRFTKSLRAAIEDELEETQKQYEYNVGERIAQLVIVPIPHIELMESEELSETVRGEGGYGSTGN
jgi:dUTP pyrophosphatase